MSIFRFYSIIRMPKTPTVSHVTRGATDHFLIGHHQSSLDSGGKLPVSSKILQYLKYLQSLPGRQNTPAKSLICCPLVRTTKSADCNGPGGCMVKDDRCVVAALAGYWATAGFLIISDQAMSTNVLKLLDGWKQICMDRKKSSVAVIIVLLIPYLKP